MKQLTVLRPALAYWLGVFALGFVLGTIRTLWLAPQVGPLLAVAAELPFMLVASWLWAGRVLRRWPLHNRMLAVTMGMLALQLLLLGELALALALGQSGQQWARSLVTASGGLGLAGQLLFALIPAARWRPA